MSSGGSPSSGPSPSPAGAPSPAGLPSPGPANVPTFALTFDTELVWGFVDRLGPDAYAARYPETRETYESLIRLLERYEVPATWAIVGHLFLSECRRGAGDCAHAELFGPVRPDGRSWYAPDPGTNRQADPLWYGDDLLDIIQAARTPQEIACHSFGHIPFGHPDVTAEAAAADLSACIEAAARRGVTLRSFVFPRNWEGHHEVLGQLGFRAYRGADPEWFSPLPRPLRRVAHVADNLAAVPAPVARPVERLPGLWNIPGSGLLAPRNGAWRLVPRLSRVVKVRRGLRRAQGAGGVFHLWTHPGNIATDEPFMLATLEAILASAAAARDRGEIAIETMGAIAERMGGMAAPPPEPLVAATGRSR